MILRRVGTKTKMAKELQKFFPSHSIFIEPFFGAGGMFFNKAQSKFNIVNDIDAEVFNLFRTLLDRKEELFEMIIKMPIHKDLWNYYKDNIPKDNVEKAVRFLFLSNFGYLGKPQTLIFGAENSKEMILKNFEETFDKLKNVQFDNEDAVKFITKATKRTISKGQIGNVFIYCDPPYLETDDNYSYSFNKENVVDLFDALVDTKAKFGISEFDHPFILEQAEKKNLQINYIKERNNLKNRRTEILITNYQAHHQLF